MDSFLLATKLRVPSQPRHALERGRLIEALERGISDYKLILVSAPAGYGKTTLVSQWAHSSHLPIAWLSLGEEDNDPQRFLRYLMAAWGEVQPTIRETALGLLLTGRLPDTEAVLHAFINAADDTPDHLVFVLDDFHQIAEPSIQQALTFLLDHLPSNLHFVLASRTDPPLPLARYRARSELLELRAEDLQFLPKETAVFLRQTTGLVLSDEQVEALHTPLEGWIAGLQLAALTLRRQPAALDTLVISGKHRFIADYLSEEVLSHLPPSTEQFLLQTSILDRLCAPLCDAVTGQQGSQEMLESLERENMFLMTLDDSREWFRYHRLFADFLQEEFVHRHPNAVADLHHRAAEWYLAQDMPEQAFPHAIEGSDAEIAVQIMDRYSNAKLASGEFRVLRQWIDSIPPEWYDVYPALGLARVGLLAFTGAFEDSMRHLEKMEQRLAPAESEEVRWHQARVTSVRCLMACVQNDLPHAELYATQALAALGEDDLNWRPMIYGSLGDTYRQDGQWEKAKECYRQALVVANSPGLHFMSAHGLGALADLALRQGHLREAAAYWEKALAVIEKQENWGRLPLPVIGWVHIRMGEILYEWNAFSEAWTHLTRGLELAELGGDTRSLIAGYLIAGRLKLSEGRIAAAADYLARVQPVIEQAPFPDWTSHYERFQLDVWLAQDRLRVAVEWADEMLKVDLLEERPESEVALLAVAHVLIVKSDAPSVARALVLLERLLPAAQEAGRVGIQIEGLALQALADWRRGDLAAALTSLERALRFAEPEGYVRLFTNLGLPMARLLQEARSRNVLPDYVARLLAAFSTDRSLPLSIEGVLPEPLSSREQEILELLAAGLTNREIADKLVISPETVKKHTGTIYAKLGVSNRTEAAARARTLDLLG